MFSNNVDLALIRVFHRRKALEAALAVELREEILALRQQNPEWPENYVRTVAKEIIETAVKQAELPH